MQTGKFYLRKYRTHRHVLTAIVFKGSKYLSVVYYDDGVPKLHTKLSLKEAQYMDYLKDYPLAKAVAHMMHQSKWMNKQTLSFLNRADKQEQSDDKVEDR